MLMGLLFAASLVVVLRVIRPEQLLRVESLPDLTDFFATLQSPLTPLLPSFWAGETLFASIRGGRDLQTHALEDWMERGYAALQVMENHLKTHHYFAADQLTIADIALYGYTHVADQCDFDLSTFPAVQNWLKRVQQAPGFVAMDWRPAEVDDPASIAAEA